MIDALQQYVAPLATAVLTVWAAGLAFAAESDAELPRMLPGHPPSEAGTVSLVRSLHVAHLALLVVAGAAAGGAVMWWSAAPVGAAARLLLATLLVWALGDLLPRLLAAIAPELGAPARRLAARTLAPFAPLLRIVAWADARAGVASPAAEHAVAAAAQRDMFLGVFSLADTTVAEVMTPRIDIVAVDLTTEFDEVVTTLRSSEHARLLVYDGHPDAVVGILYAKDLLASLREPVADGDRAWHALIRPAVFVPEGKTLDRQLHDFQRGPSHIAVVVDEFGGTAGLVTLEDILEQIVGEIQDEYDTDEVAPIQEAGVGRYRVQGGAALSELEALLGHSFEQEDVSTVGGLVLAKFGRVPRAGESVRLNGYEIVVEQVVRRRVRRVSVRRTDDRAAAEAGMEDARS